jgi:hypothetical protein
MVARLPDEASARTREGARAPHFQLESFRLMRAVKAGAALPRSFVSHKGRPPQNCSFRFNKKEAGLTRNGQRMGLLCLIATTKTIKLFPDLLELVDQVQSQRDGIGIARGAGNSAAKWIGAVETVVPTEFSPADHIFPERVIGCYRDTAQLVAA